jgi:GDP-L-fucose synthase
MNKYLINNFWKSKKVLVTGGTGFIGSHLVNRLIELGAQVTLITRNENAQFLFKKCRVIIGDCRNSDVAKEACNNQEIVFHLAARVAGIEFNRLHPDIMYHDNIDITTSVVEAARVCKVARFLMVSSACVYPHNAIIPTPENEGMRDEPEETNSGYGWAKRNSELLAMLYAKEYGMKIGIIRPYNAYGPGDHFNNLDSHVIPSLICRINSGEDPLIVWGSGKQTRSFLYVEDLAEGMIKAIERYPKPDPLNLGSNEEISIRDLVSLICRISGKNPKIVFDTTKPDGSPRRKSDNRKAEELIKFKAGTDLITGIAKTIEWYKKIIFK